MSGHDLSFLRGDPAPVGASEPATAGRRLPPAIVDEIMAVPGVLGVWIEASRPGAPEVVVAMQDAAILGQLPPQIDGLPVRAKIMRSIDALPTGR
jgi:hypothetical protein